MGVSLLQAGAAGFGYVVLWCSEDLVGFYSRCGYVPTDALRLERKAHEALGASFPSGRRTYILEFFLSRVHERERERERESERR